MFPNSASAKNPGSVSTVSDVTSDVPPDTPASISDDHNLLDEKKKTCPIKRKAKRNTKYKRKEADGKQSISKEESLKESNSISSNYNQLSVKPIQHTGSKSDKTSAPVIGANPIIIPPTSRKQGCTSVTTSVIRMAKRVPARSINMKRQRFEDKDNKELSEDSAHHSNPTSSNTYHNTSSTFLSYPRNPSPGQEYINYLNNLNNPVIPPRLRQRPSSYELSASSENSNFSYSKPFASFGLDNYEKEKLSERNVYRDLSIEPSAIQTSSIERGSADCQLNPEDKQMGTYFQNTFDLNKFNSQTPQYHVQDQYDSQRNDVSELNLRYLDMSNKEYSNSQLIIEPTYPYYTSNQSNLNSSNFNMIPNDQQYVENSQLNIQRVGSPVSLNMLVPTLGNMGRPNSSEYSRSSNDTVIKRASTYHSLNEDQSNFSLNYPEFRVNNGLFIPQQPHTSTFVEVSSLLLLVYLLFVLSL